MLVPDNKKLKKEWVCFADGSRGTVHHSDKEEEVAGYTVPKSGSREESMTVLLQLSVFNSHQKPDLWNGTTHMQGGPSYLNYVL